MTEAVNMKRKNGNEFGGFLMGEWIKIQLDNLELLREVDPRMVSYNVEMTEVTQEIFKTQSRVYDALLCGFLLFFRYFLKIITLFPKNLDYSGVGTLCLFEKENIIPKGEFL